MRADSITSATSWGEASSPNRANDSFSGYLVAGGFGTQTLRDESRSPDSSGVISDLSPGAKDGEQRGCFTTRGRNI